MQEKCQNFTYLFCLLSIQKVNKTNIYGTNLCCHLDF